MSSIVISSLIPVFLVIGVGLFLRKSGIVPEPQWRGIEALGYWLLFPVLVLVSLINMDIKNLSLGSISYSYLSGLLLHLLLIWLLRKPLNKWLNIDDRSFSSVFQTSTRWNAFIALAIASKIAGDQGLALVALIMALSVALLNLVNIIALTILTSDGKPTFRSTAIATLKVPFIWGALIGLIINLAQIPVYQPILVSLDIIGRAGLGIGLLTVGAGIQIRSLLKPRSEVLIGIVAKLFVLPLLVLISMKLFGVDGLTMQILILCAAVSTAMNGYVLAREMGGDAPLYASTASLQVIISMFSIPFWLWVVDQIK